MGALDNHIEELNEKAAEIAKAETDIKKMVSTIEISALGGLLEKFISAFDEILEGETRKQYYDKELCGTLKETVSQLVSGFSKIKSPVINVAASSIDLSPLKSIASDITKQNNTLISLIEKLNNTNDKGELYRLITAMIGKQNIFLEKGLQAADYTKELKSISDGVNKKPVEWLGKVTKRTPGDRLIDEFYIKPKQ